MPSNKILSQDSMSLEVDDRFYQSQSSSNEFIPSYQPDSNFQNKEGISQFVELSQNNNRLATSLNPKSSQNNLLKKSHTDFESRQSLLQNQNQKTIQKQMKQIKKGKKKLTSDKKKYNSKNYRQRKKQYIQKLQDQHKFYKNKAAQLQQKLFLLQKELCELKYDHQNHYKTGFQKNYHEHVEHLKEKIVQNKLPQSQITKIAMKLRQKYGPAGNERKMILNYYMSEYINNTMQDFQKYILSSVLKKSGPFGECRSILDDKINDILNVNEAQRLNLTNNIFPDLYPLAVSFSNCCKNIYKDYVSLLQEANKFHQMMQKGLNYVVLPQLANLVIWFEQNKSIPQVRRLKEQWIRIFSGQIQPQPFYA